MLFTQKYYHPMELCFTIGTLGTWYVVCQEDIINESHTATIVDGLDQAIQSIAGLIKARQGV